MTTINLDATNWTSVNDCLEDLKLKLGSPQWHGNNVNAFIDSIVIGDINKIELPYTIHIHNINYVKPDVRSGVEDFFSDIEDAAKSEGMSDKLEFLVD